MLAAIVRTQSVPRQFLELILLDVKRAGLVELMRRGLSLGAPGGSRSG